MYLGEKILMEWCFQEDGQQQHLSLPTLGKSCFQLKDKGHPNGSSLPHSIPMGLRFLSSGLQRQPDWLVSIKSGWIPWTARTRSLQVWLFPSLWQPPVLPKNQCCRLGELSAQWVASQLKCVSTVVWFPLPSTYSPQGCLKRCSGGVRDPVGAAQGIVGIRCVCRGEWQKSPPCMHWSFW